MNLNLFDDKGGVVLHEMESTLMRSEMNSRRSDNAGMPSCQKKPETTNLGIPKAEPLVGCGAKPHK